ncbi:MAG: neutral/alkaline non-lysosomal ceramidase N-terminal domain-containing protein [Clostridia bacterium]|nr:neutral/alkaline non-lysosomal ceramidase N-terminal domain-containing protein [Clostridia bacterium]
MEKLQLGVGRTVITPEIGCKLMGYRNDFYSDSLHDDLTATAFWFRQGNTDAVMVNLTVCNTASYLRDLIAAKAAERYGISAGAVTLSSTHTHSGPFTATPTKLPEDWGVMDPTYIEGVFIPRILKAIGLAKDALRPVTMGYAKGESRIGVNRRQINADNSVKLGQNPWGSFDPTMTVLSFKDENGEIYANMVHYGCHNTAAGRHPAISRDWSGIMVDRMEQLTGGITAFFNGTAGDTGPRLSNGGTTGKGDYSYVHELGNVAAQDAMRIWKTIRSYRDESLRIADCTLTLPILPRESLEEAKKMQSSAVEGGSATQRAYARHYKEVIESYESGYVEKESYTFPSRIIRLGEVAFYGLPFEPFSGLALRIRDYSELPHPVCLGYTDGSNGYFPTRDQLALGGYEVTIARLRNLQPYAEDADWHLITQVVENLKKVSD